MLLANQEEMFFMPPYGRRSSPRRVVGPAYSLPHTPQLPERPRVPLDPQPREDLGERIEIAISVDSPPRPVSLWVVQSRPMPMRQAHELRDVLNSLGFDSDVIYHSMEDEAEMQARLGLSSSA